MERKPWNKRSEKEASTPSSRPTKAEINRQLRSWPPRRIASWSLMLGGFAIAGQHMLAHLGARPLPFSMGWQDLLVGYPMAFAVALVGAMLIDPRTKV